jgi:lipid-A-disaccharide synthase
VRAAADLVLCVLPFETAFYESHGVNSRFIGHPLADAIPLQVDRAAARSRLGLDRDRPLLAILPGSRRAEVARLARPFLETAHWLQRQRPELATAVALASETLGELLRSACRGLELVPAPSVIAGRSRDVMAAADVVLTASGTASLEAMLLKRPMVVAYRLSPLTYWLVRRLGVGRLTHFSLPNLLAGRTVVPEFVQEQVRADVLGPAVLGYLDGNALDAGWYDVFARIHGELRCNASAAAAQAVLGLVRQETAGSGGA